MSLLLWPLLVVTAYLAWLALGAWLTPQRGIRRVHPHPLVLLVPAHQEAANIQTCVRQLLKQSYPLFRVVVVADNCTDQTAQLARQVADERVEVWERHDPVAMGKGHALAWALERLKRSAFPWHAVVLVDADTRLDSRFLEAMADGLHQGQVAQQGDYRISPPLTRWRQKMADVSAALYHHLRARGRQYLGLSAGLFGNGMCFARSVIEDIGWPALSRVEDIEYQAILALHGIRVHYQENAKLWAEAPSTLTRSSGQRERWEIGRYRVARHYLPRLLSQPSRLTLAMALDLAMPSFTLVFGYWLLLAFPGLAWGDADFWQGWNMVGAGLAFYLASGLILGRVPLKTALALMGAPVFALWVARVHLTGWRKPEGKWERTPREAEHTAPKSD